MSNAEKLILDFFQRRNRTDDTACSLYHSRQGAFPDFLLKVLPEGVELRCIEIFSPYFSPAADEAGWLASLSPTFACKCQC
jgi:hypothetical protein